MDNEQQKYNEEYVKAAKRLEDLKGFYSNLVAYILVIPFLIFINYMTYWGYQWFWFPMVGWGLGVLSHAAETFEWKILFGRDWEERKIKEFMDNDDIYL